VRITKPFYFGKNEVTVGQFRRFVRDSGYKTEAEKDGEGGWGYNAATGKCEGRRFQYHWQNPGFPQADDHPVLDVTWNDAIAFCAWLSRKEGKTYRLPTEAEWEYACRAGAQTPWFWGDASRDIGYYAWHKGNAGELNLTHPVARKHPNPWGLYDMIGNVWELCSDGDSGGYDLNDVVDPTGTKFNPGIKVARGGSINCDADKCRAAYRLAQGVDIMLYETGFRVVCEKE